MREYATVSAKFWIGETGRKLRGDSETQVLCFYLMSCPNSNMLGLYYLPLPTLCHELGMSTEGALKALRRVEELGFASYDCDSEWVWVHEMARFQIGASLVKTDKRVKGINKVFSDCLNSPFAKEFHDRYRAAFHLTGFENRLNNRRGIEAPSKPHRSQEQEQEQEQEVITLSPAYESQIGSSPVPRAPMAESLPEPNAAIHGIEINGELVMYQDDPERWGVAFVRWWNGLSGVHKWPLQDLDETLRGELYRRMLNSSWFWKTAGAEFPLDSPSDWKPSLSWFLEPQNVSKIISGKYRKTTLKKPKPSTKHGPDNTGSTYVPERDGKYPVIGWK